MQWSSFHIFSGLDGSFPFLTESYSVVWLYHRLFTHSSTKNILVASLFWHVKIKLPYTFVCRFLCGLKFSTHLGKYLGPRSVVAGSYSMFRFIRNCQSTKTSIKFVFLTAANGCSCCSTSSPKFGFGGFLLLFLFCSSNRSVMGSHRCVHLQLLNHALWWASFHRLTCHLFIFSRVVLSQIFCPIFKWIDYFLTVEF